MRYRAELREGNPVTALLELADDVAADLVVVGNRGVGGFPGLQLGSTSTQLAQHAVGPSSSSPNGSREDDAPWTRKRLGTFGSNAAPRRDAS